MSKEEFGDKGKWTSHKKAWTLDKKFDGNGVHIDLNKMVIRFNPKTSMVRFETSGIFHVYEWIPEPKVKGEPFATVVS